MQLLKTLLLALICFSLTLPVMADDTQAAANFLPGTATGSLGLPISNPDIADWYYFITGTDGDVTATVSFSGTLVGAVGLFTTNGGLYASSGNSSGTTSTTRQCLKADTIWLRVARASGDGGYTVSYSVSPPAGGNDTEPNDLLAEALPLSVGGSKTGHLGYSSDHSGLDHSDYYRIVTAAEGKVEFSADLTGTLHASIGLFTKNGGLLASSGIDTGHVESFDDCLQPDTFYIRVNRSTGCGAYTVSAKLRVPALANDPEPNDLLAMGVPLNPQTTVSGLLGYWDADEGVDVSDYYRIITDFDATVNVFVEFDNSIIGAVALYQKTGGLLASSGNGTGLISTSRVCLAPDTLFIRVTRASGCGNYTLRYEQVNANTPNDLEPNDTRLETMILLPIDSGTVGHLGYSSVTAGLDATDYYQIITTEDGTVTAEVSLQSTLVGSLALFTKAGGLLTSSGSATGGLSISRSCRSADTMYVRVIRSSGCGTYGLKYTVIPPDLSIDAEPNDLLSSALSLPPNDSRTGHLGYINSSGLDANDYYSVIIPVTGNFTITSVLDSTVNGALSFFTNAGGFLGATSTGTGVHTFTYNITLPDTYFVRLSRTSGCGSYEIINNALPVAGFTASPTATCTGDSLLYINTSAYATNWNWSFGLGVPSTSSRRNPSVSYPSIGTYDVSLIVSNVYGADTLTLPNFISVGDTGTASFAITPANPGGSEGSIDLSIIGSNPPFTFLWSNGATSEDLNGLGSGLFNVTIRDSFGCSWTEGPLEVRSCRTDTHEPNDSSGIATPLFGGALGGIAKRYICPAGDQDWYSFSLQKPKDVVIRLENLADDYRLELFNGPDHVVSDNPGTQDEKIIRSKSAHKLFFIKVSGNGDAADADQPYHIFVNTSKPAPTGVAGSKPPPELELFFKMDGPEDLFRAFPNPTTDQLNIEFSTSGDANVQIRLMDVLGKIVRSKTQRTTNGQNESMLDLQGLPTGIYFLKVDAGDQIWDQKILKE